MSKRPYKDFDLPNKHLSNARHFVPPKARNPEEIERRRNQPTGTLIAEYQYRGSAIANIILGLVREPEDIRFAASILGPAGINTAWYNAAQNAPVMRRRLKLPVLATEDPEQRPSSYMLLRQAADSFNLTTENAYRLVVATRLGLHTIEAYKRQLARNSGHAALTLASAEIGDRVGYGDIQATDFELQDLARRQGMNALQQGRILEATVGSPPTLAGLADRDSDLAVYWRRHAPNGALDAYEQAVAEMAV